MTRGPEPNHYYFIPEIALAKSSKSKHAKFGAYPSLTVKWKTYPYVQET